MALGRKQKIRGFFELALFYILPPLLISFFQPSRLVIFSCLWGGAFLSFFYLFRQPSFSWKSFLWGQGWPLSARKKAAFLAMGAIPVLALLSGLVTPARFLSLPLERPGLWLLILFLYPLLSVLPQTIFYRVLFFTRYEIIFSSPLMAALIHGLCFGLAHSMYGNFTAPLLASIGGVILGRHYQEHRSLLWSVLEHAFYGSLIFTLGIGWLFFKHG